MSKLLKEFKDRSFNMRRSVVIYRTSTYCEIPVGYLAWLKRRNQQKGGNNGKTL